MGRVLLLISSFFLSAVAAAAAGADNCTLCPDMVKIPGGSFQMGSPSSEEGRSDNEAPVHTVKVKAFLLAKYPVTRGQFAAFVSDTGYQSSGCRTIELEDGNWKKALRDNRSWRDPAFGQGDDHPVVCVSWDDAQAYAQWVSRKTGKVYRLPTEAEWEYSARAGTTTARYWGESVSDQCHYANGVDQTAAKVYSYKDKNPPADCKDGYVQSSPVGSFKPNSFGLYDMLGNAWQWVEDCYHDTYDGAPTDASAWTSDKCKYRVARGGGWGGTPHRLRSAFRLKDEHGHRFPNLGFRLARTE